MDFGKILKKGFDAYVQDIVPLILAGLIASILTVLTLGVLGGPLMAGLYRMIVLRQREDKKPEIGDVFYFERFGSFVVAFYLISIFIGIGFMLLFVPGLFLATIWIYVLPLMVDEGLDVFEAMKRSKQLVDKAGLGPHFVLVLILGVIHAAASGLTRGAAAALTTPFMFTCVVVSYMDLTAEPEQAAPTEPAEARVVDD